MDFTLVMLVISLARIWTLLQYSSFEFQFFTPDSGFRVRQVEQQKSTRLAVAKRVTDVFRSEVQLLRFLASRDMSSERNHVVIPTQILWGQRIYIIPFYHEGYGNANTPNAVLSIAKQLAEVNTIKQALTPPG